MAAYARVSAGRIRRPIPVLVAGCAALCAATALLAAAPWALLLGLAAAGAGAAALLAYDFPLAVTLAWLLLAGSTPEYWLADAVGGASAMVAAEKFAGFGVAAVCALRFGLRADPCNPAYAFAAICAWGFGRGVHPRLDALESLRSLAGSVAPFAFGFVRLPAAWGRAVIAGVTLLPPILVLLGAAFALAGLHPLVVEQSGLRLQATGIPAFLGGFTEAASYACLLETMRTGRARDALLLGVNLLILVLSGARAPLAVFCAIGLLAILLARSRFVPAADRLPVLLVGLLAIPLLLGIASIAATDIRLLNVLSGDAGAMSGRDLLWPHFARAWEEQPGFGWGLGAAKVIIPPYAAIAHLTGTTAPHNEYLRIGVEGGWAGLLLLLACFAGWTWLRTRTLPRIDRLMLRLAMIGIGIHAAADNLLISTTAGILFAWFVAAFVRGAAEAGGAAENEVARRGHTSA